MPTSHDPSAGGHDEARRGTGAGGGWVRAHRRLLGIVAAAVLLYAAAGFLLVPWVARREAVAYVQRDSGRHLDIATIRFNPFTFTVQVRGLALSESDGTPILGFNRLLVRASVASSLLHWAWTLQQIRIEQPDVHLVVAADGTLNLARLAPPAAAHTPPPKSGGGLPRLRVGRLAIVDGSVHYEDHSAGRAFATTLRPIELALDNFQTMPDHDSRYAFRARTLANETLEWAGVFSVQPLGSSGRFAVQGLRAGTIAAYLKDLLPLRMPAGTVNLDGTYSLALEPALGLKVQLAHLQLRDFAFAPKQVDAGGTVGTGAVGVASVAGANEPWIQLPALDVDDTTLSLADRRVAVGSIDVKGLNARVWRERDGSINLMHWMGGEPGTGGEPGGGRDRNSGGGVAGAGAGTAGGAAGAPAPGSAWHFSLGTFALTDGVVEAEDRSVAPTVKLRLAPVHVTVTGYSNEPGNRFDLDAGIGIDRGSVAVKGRAGLAPFETALDLTLQDLQLPLLQPYIKPALRVVSGRLGARLKVVLAAKPAPGGPALRVTGKVEVADLATRDDATNRNLVTWQALQVGGLDFSLRPNHLLIRRVVANQLYGRVRIEADGQLNIAQVLAGATPAKAAAVQGGNASGALPGTHGDTARRRHGTPVATPASVPAAAIMPIAIHEIVIRNSAADFSDLTVQPQFASGILDLNGTIGGLSSDPQSRAQVKLTGKVDRYAPVTIDGQVNLLSAVTYTDISMQFHNMDLTTFNPYSGKFAGYSIQQGKLSTDLHYRIDRRKLDAQHHIVIDQLEFGAATGSKQAVPLPIKLAVALLKDRNGVITLDLPVSGSLDDPSFRIGPIVWKVFVGLLRRIVTSPFAALGALFGHGPDLAYVDFPAGSAVLPQAQIDKLKTLAKGLADRPQLKLQIPLETIGPADGEVLANAALDAAAAPEATPASPPGLPPLAALYQRVQGRKPVYPKEDKDAATRVAWLRAQLLPRFAPMAPQFMRLGRQRADAARNAVLMDTGVAPERVFLTQTASGSGSIPATAHAPAGRNVVAPAAASKAGPAAPVTVRMPLTLG